MSLGSKNTLPLRGPLLAGTALKVRKPFLLTHICLCDGYPPVFREGRRPRGKHGLESSLPGLELLVLSPLVCLSPWGLDRDLGIWGRGDACGLIPENGQK